MPLAVHDALRRGCVSETIRHLQDANPGLGAVDARTAVQRLAEHPSGALDPDDPFQPAGGSAPQPTGTLPSEVAAKIANGKCGQASARRQAGHERGRGPRNGRQALLAAAERGAAGNGRARDSANYGWLFWVLAVVVVGGGLALWLGWPRAVRRVNAWPAPACAP
ncbi:hypothetical protein CNR27_13945 [Luteimonas chenhongjianii]|uniref:Uncharacterized protein n=1 Tax=Luteimonas chenhongjianii TaxID=2006110 RepID=A0A290XGX8_9GAMM|nr:hypothetical protein CNR27_13945 [Luteimonas chenhongjianii]